MPLLEVMLSCMIWSGALLAGLQLWVRGAMQRQNLVQRAELLRQVERDRLQLQQRWRALAGGPALIPTWLISLWSPMSSPRLLVFAVCWN